MPWAFLVTLRLELRLGAPPTWKTLSHWPLSGCPSRLQSSQAWAFFMCFEHERIHIETSSVLIREVQAICHRTQPAGRCGMGEAGCRCADGKREAVGDGPALVNAVEVA